MTRGLIRGWNARVKPLDTVYHLGDFAFGSPAMGASILAKLNGAKKILIRGNHDRSAGKMLEMGFHEVRESAYLDTEVGPIFLRHKPLDFSEPWCDAAHMLCGHVHEEWARKTWAERREVDIINVGVDVRNYEPKTLAELLGGFPVNSF